MPLDTASRAWVGLRRSVQLPDRPLVESNSRNLDHLAGRVAPSKPGLLSLRHVVLRRVKGRFRIPDRLRLYSSPPATLFGTPEPADGYPRYGSRFPLFIVLGSCSGTALFGGGLALTHSIPGLSRSS